MVQNLNESYSFALISVLQIHQVHASPLVKAGLVPLCFDGFFQGLETFLRVFPRVGTFSRLKKGPVMQSGCRFSIAEPVQNGKTQYPQTKNRQKFPVVKRAGCVCKCFGGDYWTPFALRKALYCWSVFMMCLVSQLLRKFMISTDSPILSASKSRLKLPTFWTNIACSLLCAAVSG